MRGVVVAPQPPAAEAGADILREGGNAFDAAVAAAFVQAATDPFMCGIGGIGVAQVYDATTGEHIILDFVGRVGARARPDQWAKLARRTAEGKTYVEGWGNYLGYQSILIPGTVAGLAAIHAGRGRLPWRDLVQPAIRILRDGFPLPTYITDYFLDTHQYPLGAHVPTFDAFVRTTDAMARLWLRDDGSPRRIGDHLTNPDYAAMLECIAEEGADAFYRGAIAGRIMADFAAHDALITADDLASTQAIVRTPLRSAYRGATVATSPLGGATVLQILNILEGFPLAEMEHNGADYLHLLAAAMHLAFSERDQLTGEGDDVTLEHLLSTQHAAELRARIDAAGVPAEAAAVPGTTHLSVADKDGSAVALTHTLSMGSGVVTEGLGFQYNNGMGSFDPLPGKPRSIAPGKPRITPMAPTMVFRGGGPEMILGSPGSNAIINAIAQVLVNCIDFGMTPLEAVSAPRIHCEGGPVMTETRIPAAVQRALAARGHQLRPRPFAYDSLQGRIQLIARGDEGWIGASDPRRDGGIALYA